MKKLKNTIPAQTLSMHQDKNCPSDILTKLLDERSFEHHLQERFFRISFVARYLWAKSEEHEDYYQLLSDLSDIIDKHLDIADELSKTSEDSQSAV